MILTYTAWLQEQWKWDLIASCYLGAQAISALTNFRTSISISNPVNQLHEIHMPERMAYTWKWIQSLFCTLLHWIRSVPGRCDDVVVVVRFGTYKVGFQVKERASPVVFVGRNTSVVFIISLYYGRLLSHHVWLTGIFAFVLKCPHSVDSFH